MKVNAVHGIESFLLPALLTIITTTPKTPLRCCPAVSAVGIGEEIADMHSQTG